MDLDDLLSKITTPLEAFFFAYKYPYKQFICQNIILNQKNIKYAYYFAKYIKGADIKALENVILQSNNLNYITKFACNIDKCNYKKLEKIILKSQNVKFIHELLKSNKISLKKAKPFILYSKKPRYLYELSKQITSQKDFDIIQESIIQSGSLLYIRLLANHKLANVSLLEQIIIDSGNSYEIKQFAKTVKKSSMKPFLLLI
jgi:hypothetical protein